MINLNNKSILHLTLKAAPFEVMVTGEKTEEYRRSSPWIESRLFTEGNQYNKKHYDLVLYRNGYGKNKPYFICEYKGFELVNERITQTYSNGLIIDTCMPTAIIKNGAILEVGNYEAP